MVAETEAEIILDIDNSEGEMTLSRRAGSQPLRLNCV